MVCQYNFIAQLGEGEKERLLLSSREISLPTNHQLLFQSDWGSQTFLITGGIAKARSLCLAGREVVISLMGAGALIGDLALLSLQPIRSLDVVALTPLTLLKLRPAALPEAMDGNSKVTHALACLQAQRLIALGNRLMLMQEDATTRLLATLWHLARLHSPEDDPQPAIPAIPQHEIASIAGLSRGTTSTLITKLRSKGTLASNARGELQFVTLEPLERRGLLPYPRTNTGTRLKAGVPLRGLSDRWSEERMDRWTSNPTPSDPPEPPEGEASPRRDGLPRRLSRGQAPPSVPAPYRKGSSNFQAARSNTRARQRRIQATGRWRLPRRDPTDPATSTTINIRPNPAGRPHPAAPAGRARRSPAKPMKELPRMNREATAAAWRVEAQRPSSSNGVRKTPPPVPVSPASSPRPAPQPTKTRADGARSVAGSRGCCRKRNAEASSTRPTSP